MNRIFRELKSVSGGILGLTIMLIVTFFVWNFLSQNGPGPVGGFASWIQGHATGDAYAPAAPAMTVNAPSAYSTNNNLGPQI